MFDFFFFFFDFVCSSPCVQPYFSCPKLLSSECTYYRFDFGLYDTSVIKRERRFAQILFGWAKKSGQHVRALTPAFVPSLCFSFIWVDFDALCGLSLMVFTRFNLTVPSSPSLLFIAEPELWFVHSHCIWFDMGHDFA